MKLKEYATKIKNRLVGQRAKPQEEEKDDLSEKIAERTQELIAEDRQEAVRAAVIEEPEEITEPEEPEPKEEERNIGADAMRLAAITKGLTIDPEWSKDDMIKAISEYSGLPEDEVEALLASTVKWIQEVKKVITDVLVKKKWTYFQLCKELISNNRRKMKGMPMIRAKALEKARKNKRRKPEK